MLLFIDCDQFSLTTFILLVSRKTLHDEPPLGGCWNIPGCWTPRTRKWTWLILLGRFGTGKIRRRITPLFIISHVFISLLQFASWNWRLLIPLSLLVCIVSFSELTSFYFLEGGPGYHSDPIMLRTTFCPSLRESTTLLHLNGRLVIFQAFLLLPRCMWFSHQLYCIFTKCVWYFPFLH